MDWLASEEGSKAAVEVEKARKRLLATVQLGDVLRKTITEARTCHTDVKALKLRLEEQQLREHMLQEDFKDLWLRVTCDQLYHTLPRELRDMIYQIVMDETIACFDSAGSTTDPGGVPWKLAHEAFGSSDHFLKCKFVGGDVFRELMETSYRTVNIPRRLMENGNIEDFLNRDKWDLGFRPLKNIRSVKIDVHEEQFKNANLHRNLSSFLNLSPGTSISLDLIPLRSRSGFCWRHTVWQQQQGIVFSMDAAEITSFFEKLSSVVQTLDHLKDVGMFLQVTLVYNDWPRRSTKLQVPGTMRSLSMDAWHSDVSALKHKLDTGKLCLCEAENNEADDDADSEDDNTEEEEEELDSGSEEESEQEDVDENEN